MHTPYASPVEFAQGFHAAAVYCSDGRFGAAIDDFLTNGQSLARVDRIAIPGGPAGLADHPQGNLDAQAVLDDLAFLVEAHELDRIILIQHAGCAFYGQVLGVPDAHLPSLQRADLVRAAHRLRAATPQANVEGWLANVDGATITFEPVELD